MAAQRLCLQNIWTSTGSSGVWELTESSCPPQSFLPLLICGFQPCHSAFYLNFHRVSDIFYLIKSHLKDNLLVSFNFSLILELADGALASGIGSFPASPFQYSTLHFVKQRCNTSWSPSISCTLQRAFLSAFLFLELVDSVQHCIMHLYIEEFRRVQSVSSSPMALLISNLKPKLRDIQADFTPFSILNLHSPPGLLKLHST